MCWRCFIWVLFALQTFHNIHIGFGESGGRYLLLIVLLLCIFDAVFIPMPFHRIHSLWSCFRSFHSFLMQNDWPVLSVSKRSNLQQCFVLSYIRKLIDVLVLWWCSVCFECGYSSKSLLVHNYQPDGVFCIWGLCFLCVCVCVCIRVCASVNYYIICMLIENILTLGFSVVWC